MKNENEKKENVVAEQQPKQIVLEELDKKNDRVDFSNLKPGDQFQVLTRYLNDLCSFTKSILHIVADQEVLTEFIAAKLGVDIQAERQKMVERIQKQMEEQEKLVKEQIKNLGKNENRA